MKNKGQNDVYAMITIVWGKKICGKGLKANTIKIFYIESDKDGGVFT
jgi:hypothetical protein